MTQLPKNMHKIPRQNAILRSAEKVEQKDNSQHTLSHFDMRTLQRFFMSYPFVFYLCTTIIFAVVLDAKVMSKKAPHTHTPSHKTSAKASSQQVDAPTTNETRQNQIVFQRISVEQGLSSSVVNAITQDKRGFLWFGTQDGLNRYDGITFTHYVNPLPDSLGAGGNTITAIFEDKTGVLWLATENTRCISLFTPSTLTFSFLEYAPKKPTGLSISHVNTFFEDSDGIVWLGGKGGINVFNRSTQEFKRIVLPDADSLTTVVGIAEDHTGTLWVATRTMLYTYNRSAGSFSAAMAHLSPTITGLVAERDSANSKLWVLTAKDGLYNIAPTTQAIINHYSYSADNPRSISSNTIHSLCISKTNDVWVGTNKGLSIIERNSGIIRRLANDPRNPGSLGGNVIQTIYEDRSGVLWAASEFYGVNKYSRFKHKFAQYEFNPLAPQNSLSSNYVRGIWEDPNNVLWVGTQTGGLNRIDRKTKTFTHYRFTAGTGRGLQSDTVWTVLRDKQGVLWVGTVGAGLYMLQAGSENFVPFSAISRSATIQMMFEDKNGALWISGTNTPLTMIASDRKTLRQYTHNPTDAHSISSSNVYCALEDAQGKMWFGTLHGLNMFDRSTQRFTHFMHQPDKEGTLSNNAVTALFQDAMGTLWVGTRNGLNKFYPNVSKFDVLTEREGLPSNSICAITEDKNGNLWISTKNSLAHYNPRTEKIQTFDADDGIQGKEFHRGSVFKSTSGELFFGGTNGVNAFFSENISNNGVQAPVIITSFKKFGREHLVDSAAYTLHNVVLRHDENFLSFEFIALDFNSPENNTYAYKLEGVDKAWVQCGTRREAVYTSLDPGEYTFRVRASNNDGVWNEEGASLHIVITPPLWRTGWFIGLASASVVCVAFVLYRARIRRMEARNELLERQVAERTAEIQYQMEILDEQAQEIEIKNDELQTSLESINILNSVLEGEREKSETLLLNVLPPSIAERLKWGETTIVDKFDHVSVLFSDMVGFTKISSQIPPEELIVLLNQMFLEFDKLAEKHGVEKIKTIGDAYMAVAGVPIPNEHHAEAAADMALDMVEAVKNFQTPGGIPINIRVGIHTGGVTAGIIGEKKFAYDLWGDTVNTASRMESSGEAGKVQCSAPMYEILKDNYILEERGVIEVKGKGAMKTYFVLGRKSGRK